jgi:putative transposase
MPQSLSNLLVHLIFSTKERHPSSSHPNSCSGRTPTWAAFCEKLDLHPWWLGAQPIMSTPFSNWPEPSRSVVEKLKSCSSLWLKAQKVENFAWQRGYGCFSLGQSQSATLIRYIENQAEHHRRVTFQEEYRLFLQRYEITFDERYVWD